MRTPQGAPLGEVFSFLSGLYFRGKLTYARRFARPAPGLEGCYVITSDAGLASPDEPVTLERLQRFSQTPIDVNDPRYVRPLEVSVHGILQRLPPQGQVVLLGSIATGKYVSILREHFGARLAFPADFAGRGDMSRGGLMLRAVGAGVELEYAPIAEAASRTGKRRARLERARRDASNRREDR